MGLLAAGTYDLRRSTHARRNSARKVSPGCAGKNAAVLHLPGRRGAHRVAQHAAGSAQPFTFWIRIENAIVSYARYIGKALWPTNLALYYPHPGATLAWWQTAGAFLLLLIITVLSLRARRHRYLIVGWLWFLIMLIPMIGLLQVDVQGMADRYAYVSFMACS